MSNWFCFGLYFIFQTPKVGLGPPENAFEYPVGPQTIAKPYLSQHMRFRCIWANTCMYIQSRDVDEDSVFMNLHLRLCMLGNGSCFCCRLFTFFKILSGTLIRVSNRLDPVQDRHSIGLDLGSNCLQMLLTDKKVELARKEVAAASIFSVCEQRRLWPVCTFALAHLNFSCRTTLKVPVSVDSCYEMILTLKVPTTTAADYKFCDIFPNF